MLKVFTSTHETQGQRANDFNFVPEGEIVTFHMITCSNETADVRCGCCRSMSGVTSLTATTTMKVIEFDGTLTDLARIIYASLREGDWTDSAYEQAGLVSTDARVIAQGIIDAARPFPVGAVVEYRDGEFTERQPVVQEVRDPIAEC